MNKKGVSIHFMPLMPNNFSVILYSYSEQLFTLKYLMWTHYSNDYAQVYTSATMQLLYNLGSHDHGS